MPCLGVGTAEELILEQEFPQVPLEADIGPEGQQSSGEEEI